MVIFVYKAIYPTLPKKVWRMLYLLLSPFAWLLIQALASPLSLQIYVMQLGLIDFIAMFALLPENYLDAPIDWRSPGQIFSNIKSYPGFYLTWYFIILLGGVGLGVALRILFVQIVALQAQINWLNYQLVFVAAIFASSVVHAYYALKPVVKASPDCISIVNQYRKMKTDHAAKK
jgi:hypothetical protein